MPRNSKTASSSKVASRRKSAGVRRKKVSLAENPKPAFRGFTQSFFDEVLARVKKMTQAELVESLKACGVLTPSGKLAKQYRD
ncbi:MAG: hypothetical protein ACO1TE_12950 [Prosthecobacter sp.]